MLTPLLWRKLLAKRQPIEKTRGGGRYSEAAFWSFIRSGLRAKHSRWAPRYAALAAAKRPYKGDNARQKFEYKCAVCKKWHIQKDVEVDHITPCGSLKCYDDLPGFVERMFVEVEGYRVACKSCHLKITKKEREKNASK